MNRILPREGRSRKRASRCFSTGPDRARNISPCSPCSKGSISEGERKRAPRTLPWIEEKSMRHGVSFIVALVLALPAQAEDRCTEVHFERGQSSATIRGSAPAEDVVCYTFGAGAGQTANLKVTGRNV